MNDIANHCLRHPELSGKKGLGVTFRNRCDVFEMNATK
ncbi:hypothetical protein BLL52_4229 [Rhodoferax antarcticus ANT.BR]|uniref:Uncharacterized protein n=1 Tax=Rhodoferax antarcticus ANT.BR TaxID=1111071 RepID=A0A1Q8Y950_9BURK|nr:hypothetical protein BLL52_4229 [Rhodoferax antarcticus ANT.BR]